MELGDNFDGFNCSIPPPLDTIELENNMNIWGILPDIEGDVNTVEIPTSGTELTAIEQDRITGDRIEDDNSSNAAKRKPRRRDYIRDSRERAKYFEENFQKLTLHFHRTISRTGCEGDLSALFEGKIFNTARSLNMNPLLTCTMSDVCDNSHLNSSTQEHLNPGEVDDHRYAATMLTQRESSSAVTDHQYNEKTMMPTNDFSDSEFEEECPTRKRKRPEPYEYIKISWRRDQSFSKFAKSLFKQKFVLEDRTGASVMLSLKYRSLSFNDGNYLDAYNKVLNTRKRVNNNPPKLAPKKPQNQTPVTFILPRYTPFTLPGSTVPISPANNLVVSTSAFSTGDSSATSLVMSTSGFSPADLSATRIVIPNTFCDSSSAGGIMSTDFSIPILNLQRLTEVDAAAASNSVIFPEKPDQLTSSSSLNITTLSRGSSPSHATMSPSHASEFTDYGDFLTLGSGQPSPELKASVTKCATVDCTTNTEPICSICHKIGGDDQERSKGFWIRCSDPFCYDTVHTSCIGFMITCKTHLKQLPAFYCKAHR